MDGELIDQDIDSPVALCQWSQGFYGHTEGLLLSTSARPAQGASVARTQMDGSEAVGQLKAARQLGEALGQSARQQGAHGLHSHEGEQAWATHTDAMDPAAQGKYSGAVGGRDARQARAGSRDLGDPVERFAKPLLHLDTPTSAAWVTPASIHLFSGQDHSVSAQGDVHLTASHTVSSVSGQTTSLYTHAGGIQAITANAALSVRAHTDAQQIWSEQDLTVQSTTDEVRVQASKSITLTAGQSQIVIEGGNITFTCPGTWTVKGASHDWLGGGSQAAALMLMPDGVTEVPGFIELRHTYRDQSPVKGAPYKLVFANGQVLEGKLDSQGRARIDNPPNFQAKVEFGEDDRAQPEAFIKPMENPILGAKPKTREEAQALFDQYAEQENAHLEDHFFDDEIALMQSEQGEQFDHDGYEDYAWPDEGQRANLAYRADHPSPQGGNNAASTCDV